MFSVWNACSVGRFNQLLAGPLFIWGGLNVVGDQGMVDRVRDPSW